MKKTLIVISFFIIAANLRAQNLSFGPTLGLGHSWIKVDEDVNRRFHASYSVGARMVYSFVTNWGISGDIKFSSEGQTVGLSSDDKTVFRANYVRIPLQGIYFFGKYGDRVRPKISIGPSFGFLVGGKTRLVNNGETVTKVKTSDYAKGFDFGFTVAGGGNVRISPATWLNLEVAYYHGLIDNFDSGATSKNRSLGINAGVTFPLATLLPDKVKN